MKASASRWLVLMGATMLGSCGGDDPPANVSGIYSLTFINGPNGCMVQGFTAAATGMLDLTFTQNVIDPSQLSVKVTNPLAAGVYQLVLGTDTLLGKVVGSSVDALAPGRQATTGGCMHTPIARLEGTITGNTFIGTLAWSFQTNGHADCAHRSACKTIQSVQGVRPPPL